MSSDTIKLHAIFLSWDDFQRTLKDWSDRHGVHYVRKSGHLIGWANKRAPAHLKPLEGHLKYKDAQYECKFGAIRESESAGIRPKQNSKKLGCPSRFVINAERGNPQVLRITVFKAQHCGHPIDDQEFAQFIPEKRRIIDAEQLNDIEQLIDARGKPMAIRQQVRAKTGKAVTAKDLENIRRSISKKHRKGNTDVADALGELKHLIESDPGATTCVAYSEQDNVIDFLYFQTSKMAELTRKYPEMIGVDTTYKVNRNNMHLVVYQVIDNHGNGRTVGYCFLRRETGDIVEAAMRQFVEANPIVTQKTCTVLVDKDYKEINGIRKVLPDVHVHLCHTHVLRQFRRHTPKEAHRKEVMKILMNLTECGSKKEFEDFYTQLKEKASPDFMSYFDDNWKDCKEAWIMFVRNQSLSLGARSANYVESHNSKIKSVTDRSKSLGDCIRGLLLLHANREFESAYKDFRQIAERSYIANCDDSDVADFKQYLCRWGGDLMYDEWVKMNADDVFESDLPAAEGPCYCTFYLSYGLMHCKHIFQRRKMENKPLLDRDNMRPRWLKNYGDFRGEVGGTVNSQQPSVNVLVMTTPKASKPKTENARFSEAKKLTDHIASLISPTGGQQYETRINNLKRLISIWESRREAVILPTDNCVSTENEDTEDGAATVLSHPVPQAKKDSTEQTTPTKSSVVNNPNSGSPLDQQWICTQCHTHMSRSVCQRDSRGNRGRYYWCCPKKCKGSFRWDQCPICETYNVREGHACSPIISGHLGFGSECGVQSDNFHDENSASNEHSSHVEEEPHGLTNKSHVQPSNLSQDYSRYSLDLGIDEFMSLLDDPKFVDSMWNEFDENKSYSQVKACAKTNVENLHDREERVCSDARSNASEQISESASDDQQTNDQRDWREVHEETCDINDIQSEDQQINDQLGIQEPAGGQNIITDQQYIDRFKRGLAIVKNGNVEILSPGVQWRVKSQSGKGSYKVTKKMDVCSKLCCATHFHPCMHRFVCNCLDRCNPCKHIFKIHSLEAPHEVANCRKVLTTKNPQKSVIKKQLSLEDFDELQKRLKLPPAQKVKGRPSRYINTKAYAVKKTLVQHAEDQNCDEPEGKEIEDSTPDSTDKSDDDSDRSDVWSPPEDFPSVGQSQEFNFQGFTLKKADFDALQHCRDIDDDLVDGFVKLMMINVCNKYANMHCLPSQVLESISIVGKGQSADACLMTSCAVEATTFRDIWLVPTHIARGHWILMIVFIKDKNILVLDSMHGKGKLSEETLVQVQILRSLLAIAHEKCVHRPLNWKEWTVYAPIDIPTQRNTVDCGIFVCAWLYIFCTQVPIPEDAFKNSLNMRKWLASLVFEDATVKLEKSTANPPPKPQKLHIEDVYREVDMRAAGLVEAPKADKPWLKLPKPHVIYSPVDDRSTLQYLRAATSELWRASPTMCGSSDGCRHAKEKKKPLMYQCEVCREWLHLTCVPGATTKPAQDEGYFCPEDIIETTQTRIIKMPLRHRISL